MTTASATMVPTLTLPHSTSGSERHLVVAVQHAGEGARMLTSITYGGAPLARVASAANGPRVSELWHLVAPMLGTNDIVVTFSGTPRFLIVTGISRTGIDQTNPIGAPTTATGSGVAPAVSVSSASGNVVQDVLTWDRFSSPQASATAGAIQNALTSTAGTFQLGGATSEAPGAATTSMTWTLSSGRTWSMIAMEIRAAGGPPRMSPTSVSANSTGSATINWTTDRPTYSMVEYGLTPSYGSATPLTQTLSTSHAHTLSGLSAGTTYHYQATSTDGAGNSATSAALTFTTPPAVPSSTKPNILLIVSDNQNARSVSEAMTHVQTLLAAQGVTFTNAHVPYPLCCPARATFLTGQYSHNNNVMDNGPPTGGYANLDQSHTLPVWLQTAGYHTAHIGKHLNGYGTQDTNPTDAVPACREVPLGWDEWYGNVLTDYGTTDFVLNESGSLVKYGNPTLTLPRNCPYSSSTTGFQTDVYSQKAVDIINTRAGAIDGKPFFITVAYGAPEGTLTAPRHVGAFPTFPFPAPPSLNEADMSDKPSHMQSKPLLTAAQLSTLTAQYRKHLSSLLAIDEGVRDMVGALSATGLLSNTVIFYLSDQGQLFGEHRITRLAWPYEESVRIPFIMSGAGIPAGSSVNSLVSGVDLVPTILEIAGASATRPPDGASLLPLARDPNYPWRTFSLMEANTRENSNHFNAVRDARHVYIEYGPTFSESELYDLVQDPFQLTSKHADPAYASVLLTLQTELNALRRCAGSACWR